MLSKDILQSLLDEGLKTGAEFAEIFFEDTNQSSIRVTSGDVTNASFNNIHGAGVRLMVGTDVVYGYTNDVSESSIRKLMIQLRASFNGSPNKATPLGEAKPFTYTIKKPMKEVTQQEKADKLVSLSNIIKGHDERIVQAISMLLNWEQNILVVNSNGVYQDDIRTYAKKEWVHFSNGYTYLMYKYCM